MTSHQKRIIKKILIANRAEVVRRLLYTCRAQGIKTVAIYAPEDAAAGYVQMADEAYPLPGSGVRAYLDADAVLAVAQQAAVDAVHPGYGFFSENASFAQKVIDAGLAWIGPSPACIEAMGDKVNARLIMERAGVPVVPGAFINLNDHENVSVAQAAADALGYPVIIKDPRGGGGRAMQRVNASAELPIAWRALVGQAARTTGSSKLLIEKYITGGRHVEVQIAGDGTTVIHLFERECSLQRRHQKIVEEAPCLFVDQAVLDRMYAAAVLAGQAVGYQSVGTVEFMVTPDNQFYFLEMNTRLQVEHSVTELTTGVDLVALQLAIAQGGAFDKLRMNGGVLRHGHALECRIYAEDPANNFLPSAGVITALQLPVAPFARVDHDLVVGQEITPFFDPMIAKITTFGGSRAEAAAHMREALRQLVIGGLTTNISFLRKLLCSDEFKTGQFHTQLLADQTVIRRLMAKDDEATVMPAVLGVAAAVLLEFFKQFRGTTTDDRRSTNPTPANRWRSRAWK